MRKGVKEESSETGATDGQPGHMSKQKHEQEESGIPLSTALAAWSGRLARARATPAAAYANPAMIAASPEATK